jgi:HAD superfamily hydrolase (TIGR01549 family)
MAQSIAVGFDFDHTLGIDNRLERTTALELLRERVGRLGLAYDPLEADGAIDPVLGAYRSGEQSVEAAIAGFFERFSPGGTTADVIDEASRFREAVLERTERHVVALEGARDMLTALDEMGVRYAILTNGWSPLQEEKARLIGFRGPVFVSERIGSRKPSPQAFGALLHSFELPPDQIWYVGDDPLADCAGAAAAGLTSVWYDWENVTYPAGIAPPEYTIRTLAELPALVRDRLAETANLSR